MTLRHTKPIPIQHDVDPVHNLWAAVDALEKRLAAATANEPELLGLTQELHTALAELRAAEAQRQIESTRQRTLITHVSTVLSRESSLQTMLQACTEVLVHDLEAAFARIWLLDPAQRTLELQASAGLYTHLDGPHSRVPVGELKIGRIAGTRQPHLTNNVLDDPQISDQAWAQREGMVAFAGYPLLLEDRLVGVMALFARAPLGAQTLDALAGISDAIAQGIERKRAEIILAEGEARYRSLMIATAQIIWTAQPNGDLIDAPMWREFTGQSIDEARGWGWLNALHPDDHDRVIRVWAQAIVARSQYETEYRIRKADGSYRIFAVRGVPVLGADGRVREWVGACTDITVRRRVEETQRFLVEASELLSTALDYETTFPKIARFAVPLLADWCTFDLLQHDGTIGRIALSHADPHKEALAWELHQRYPQNLDDPCGSSAVLRSGKAELMPDVPEAALRATAHDAEHLAGLGELDIQSYLCVPLIARGRTLGAMSWGLTDASRHYDEFDLHVAEDLAHRAALAMQNALLYREAQAAIKTRDQFLSIASHELKTPLTPLLLQAEAIQRRAGRTSSLSERDRQALHTIADQAQRLSRLIETLLNVSRIQLGRLTIESQRLDLVALARQVVAELQPMLTEHTLRLSCADPAVYVNGDALRLEQVLQNLLQNAIKYSPGGGAICLELMQRDDSVWIIVADQGIGIPESALPHLFQRFYRAGNVDAQNISGFGIGLYIVHEIVSLHGGSVQVTSTQGTGSTFTVQLPLATP